MCKGGRGSILIEDDDWSSIQCLITLKSYTRKTASIIFRTLRVENTFAAFLARFTIFHENSLSTLKFYTLHFFQKTASNDI